MYIYIDTQVCKHIFVSVYFYVCMHIFVCVNVCVCVQLLKEKDQQIEELSAQTQQYVNEMEANAALIEDLRAELSRSKCTHCL